MGQTGHGLIGSRYKGYGYNSTYKKASKSSNMNTDLFQHAPKTLAKKN